MTSLFPYSPLLKNWRLFLAALTLFFLPHSALAQDDEDDNGGASFQTFYDQLSDEGGQWIQTDNYGYVWQPPVQDPEWRPYAEGHWAYTDYGWTWVSDEPWGWATYHYGRWANLDGQGWVWVPGYRWAPAWVSWRYGGGYAGWAPLPPESFVGVDYARPGYSLNADFHIGGDVDVAFHIGAGCYNFVPVEHLGEPRLRGYYAPHNNNYGIINRTTNITNVYVNKTVVNNNYYNNSTHNQTVNNFNGVNTGGPSLAAVNAVSHTRLQKVQLARSDRAGVTSQDGNTLHIYAPHVNAATLHTAKPSHVDRSLTTVQVNRGDSVERPLQTTAAIKPATPTQEQIQRAHQDQNNAPASAKIAAVGAKPKVHLSEPLTHYQTSADFRKPAAQQSQAHPETQAKTVNSTPAPAEKPSAETAPHQQPSVESPSAYHEPNSTTHTPPADTNHANSEPKTSEHHQDAPQHSTSNSDPTTHPSNTSHPSSANGDKSSPHNGNSQEHHAGSNDNPQNSQPNGH